jgi:hypothetical protein
MNSPSSMRSGNAETRMRSQEPVCLFSVLSAVSVNLCFLASRGAVMNDTVSLLALAQGQRRPEEVCLSLDCGDDIRGCQVEPSSDLLFGLFVNSDLVNVIHYKDGAKNTWIAFAQCTCLGSFKSFLVFN